MLWDQTKCWLAAVVLGGFIFLTIFMLGYWIRGAEDQPVMDVLMKNQCTAPALGRSVGPQTDMQPLPYYKVLANAMMHVPPKLPTRGGR